MRPIQKKKKIFGKDNFITNLTLLRKDHFKSILLHRRIIIP